MDKQKEKELVAESEKFLVQLLEEKKLSLPQLQQLSKKLQKVNSANSKKMAENKKELSDFISDKIELKEYLEKEEQNKVILAKAAQKVLSKSQPKPTQNDTEKTPQPVQNSIFKVEKKNLIEIFQKQEFKNNLDNLYVYFEMLFKEKINSNDVPFFAMIFFPKEKKINFYLKNKDKVNLSFSQVDYLCNSGNDLFLDIDYYSMFENCELDKTREYKENCINMDKFENAPPVIILTVDTKLFELVILLSNVASTPGAVINAPNLNIASNKTVYRIFFLNSGIFQAFTKVLNTLNHLYLSATS